jgi:hypothetical protein
LHPAITSAGLLAVDVPNPPWATNRSPTGAPLRGGLREAIESAIESTLEVHGAPPPGVNDFADLDLCLSDQLFRARSVGANGFALHMPNLTSAGNLAGALDAEDSAVLRWWIAATRERPVMVLLDEANRRMGAYGPPTRLERLIEAEAVIAEVAPAAEPAETATLAGSTTGDAPDSEHDRDHDHDRDRDRDHDHDRDRDHDHDRDHDRVPSATAHETLDAGQTDTGAEKSRVLDAHGQGKKPLFANRVVPLFPRRENIPVKKAMGFAERGSAVAASLDWRGFANELEVARGPKPLSIIERLYMSRYLPLVEAIGRGEADDAARRTADEWAQNFARSYTEGFSALKITGKRPRMVLDAPQLCSQIARLHGAKSTQLVLVDAMRFDVGVRVHDRMRDALMSQATCTERLLLWSALPTTTPTQLDLLAHGPEGLASRNTPSEREEPGLRGRTSATLRRVKVGSRDLLKLDAIESRLREAGPPLAERLDMMADEVATALASHARTLAPRTLMFVFGDHGFRIDPSEGGTLSGTSGGASPEEVLVPAFAWLIGDVH